MPIEHRLANEQVDGSLEVHARREDRRSVPSTLDNCAG
jgi:hypothetical protein